MKTARKLPASPLYKHEHMRLVRRQDQGFVHRTAKSYYQAGVSNHCPRSLSQRSTGAGEFDRDPQLDRNTKREKRVKQEVTITAGVLRPRYLRTYVRPAPVNRAKEARLRLDRDHRNDEGASKRKTNETRR